MVIDTSAIVAILFIEPERAVFRAVIESAFCRHPAGLNLGDCASYALANTQGRRPLLKGSDFAQTDIQGV